MGWSIESLANIFLEALGDIMAYTIIMVGNLSLDIGMDTKVVDGRYVPEIPTLGALIDPTQTHGYFLEYIFPVAKHFTPLFMTLGFCIIAFIFLSKMAISFGGPFVKTESGGMIMARTGLAIIGTTYSFSIFIAFECLFNEVYNKFWEYYSVISAGVADYATPVNYEQPASWRQFVWPVAIYDKLTGESMLTMKDLFKQGLLNGNLIQNYAEGEGLGLTLLTIAFFLVLLVSFFKLVLEIYERYILIGVMFYTSPLAFSTIASKESSVFTEWVQMLLSEFVIMCTNLFFVGVFADAVVRIFSGRVADPNQGYVFANPHEFVCQMAMLIGWLIIGQQVDQHLKSLGLSTAQTGRGLGGAVAAGLGSAMVVMRTAAGAIKGGIGAAGDVATGNTKWQRAAGSSGPVGDFFRAKNTDYGQYSKSDAGKKLADMREGKDALFKKDSDGNFVNGTDSQRGEAIAGFTSAALGQTTFDNTLHDMGKTRADIDNANTTIDSSGVAHIAFNGDRQTLDIQTPGTQIQGANNYGKAIRGSDASVLISHDDAVKIAQAYGDKQFGADGYELINADASLLKVGDTLENVPDLIRGK